jgi:hypothetical protein
MRTITINDRLNHEDLIFAAQEYVIVPDPIGLDDRVHIYLKADGRYVTMTQESLEKAFPQEVEKREKEAFESMLHEHVYTEEYGEILVIQADKIWEYVQKLRGR